MPSAGLPHEPSAAPPTHHSRPPAPPCSRPRADTIHSRVVFQAASTPWTGRHLSSEFPTACLDQQRGPGVRLAEMEGRGKKA